jgi:hypothetical protein
MLADWFVAISRTGVIDLGFRHFLKVVLLLGGVVVNSPPLDSQVPLCRFPAKLCSCDYNGGGVQVCWIKHFWRCFCVNKI